MLLSVRKLHGDSPYSYKRTEDICTALLSWHGFCWLQSYFEVYGKAYLPVCVLYISFIPKEVPGAEAGSEFPTCFIVWQSWGETLCLNCCLGKVFYLRLRPHPVLWLEPPPSLIPLSLGLSPAVQLSGVY